MNIIPPFTGWVGAGNAKSGFPAFLQHRLVGVGTHAFIIGYLSGSQNNIQTVFESDMRVSYDLWSNYLKNAKYDMWIYEVIGLTQEEIEYAMDYCIYTFLGDAYGYLEWFYFPYQMFCRKILRHDIRKNPNWFSKWLMNGVICTELAWWFLWKATELHPEKWIELRDILKQWSPDTLTSNDWLHILEDHPNIFKIRMRRINNKPLEYFDDK
ncbi:MAG: hypothetical protein WC346_05905 [Methanogenium sp.]|jgi:hypothetical protein